MHSAALWLFVTNGSSNGPGVYGTDNSWTETGITWNNRPAPTTGVIADVGSVSRDVWAEYNVTSHVTGNGTYNFVFLPDSTNGIRFDSREGSSPPELVLSFGGGSGNEAGGWRCRRVRADREGERGVAGRGRIPGRPRRSCEPGSKS